MHNGHANEDKDEKMSATRRRIVDERSVAIGRWRRVLVVAFWGVGDDIFGGVR